MSGHSIIITGAGSASGGRRHMPSCATGWRVGADRAARGRAGRNRRGSVDALLLPCDVTDPAAVDAAFARRGATGAGSDVLFNNAGMSAARRARSTRSRSRTGWRCADVNITGMFLCARAAFGLMRRQSPQGGRIINNGSISAHVPRPGLGALHHVETRRDRADPDAWRWTGAPSTSPAARSTSATR